MKDRADKYSQHGKHVYVQHLPVLAMIMVSLEAREKEIQPGLPKIS